MTMPGGGGDRQANVTVTANVDPYVKSITAANAATLKFADALQRVDQAVLKIGKIAGAGAMAVGGAGLLKAFGDVKTSAALEQSFKSLSAQATVTGTNVGQVKQQIVALGTQIPIATQSLAAMATQMSALGVQGTANLKNLTKQAEQLAAATNTAPGQLMTGLLQLNQSLGGSLENLSRYGSALTTLQANMGVSANDVMQFVNGIEAVGAKAGVTEQQMIGMSAAFVKVGADGFAGAQAFNQVVNDMTDAVSRNSPRMQQYASLLGMTSQQFKNLVTSGNSAQAFVDFINAVTSSGARASQVLEQFGLDSVRTQRVFAALTSGQANMAQAISETNAAFDQNSAMGTAAAAAWKGFDDQLQRIQNSATQVRDALGAPLLTPITTISRAFADASASLGNFIHWADDAPWPIGDTLTSLVTKTPALILMGGAFLTLTAAVTKFSGAWRMMTGAIGINAFRGLVDGRNGNAPRELGDTGRLGSMLYRRTYAMGGGTPEVGGIIGSNARPGLGSMIAGYPLMRFRQQMGGAMDTMLHPFSPEKRNSGKSVLGFRQEVDPFSMQGMWQQGKTGYDKYRNQWISSLGDRAQETDENGNLTSAARNAATLSAVLQRGGMGPMSDSKETLQRRRFNYVQTARVSAVDRQQDLIKSMSHPQLAEAMRQAELGEYIGRTGGTEGFQGTAWENMGHRQLIRRANDGKHGLAAYAGASAARDAGTAFDASMTEEETAKLANPFTKLASKVKSISKELLDSTGTSINGIMDAIVAFYQKAVDKITALAMKAKSSIVEVQAYAENPGQSALTLMTSRPPVPDRTATQPLPVVTQAATEAATKAATDQVTKITSSLPIIAATRSPGGPLPDPASFSDRAIGFALGTQGSRTPENIPESEGGVRSTRWSWQRLQNLSGSATGQLGSRIGAGVLQAGRGAGVIGSGLLDAGKALGGLATSLLSPQVMIAATLFGPMLTRMVQSMMAANQKITSQADMAGAAIQQALGRQVLSQSDIVNQQKQKQNSKSSNDVAQNAWGSDEQKNSKAGTFQDNFSDQIGILQTLGLNGKNPSTSQQNNAQSWLQDYVNGMIAQQNGGKPLDEQQKQQVRELLMASAGNNGSLAKDVYGSIDFSGLTGSNFLQTVGGQYARQGGSTLRNQLSKSIIGNYDYNTMGGIAGLLVAAGQDKAANTYNAQTALQQAGANRPGGATGPTVGNGMGLGDSNTGGLFTQFINDYNQAHSNAKINLKGSSASSISGFYDLIKARAKAGDKGSKDVYSQLSGVLSSSDFTAQGELKQSALDRLQGLVTGGLGTQSASAAEANALNGSVLNNAYQAGMGKSGDKNSYITSLLGDPNDVSYSHNIDRVMGQLNKGSTIFSPDAIQNLKSAAQALQTVKDTLSPTDHAWQQLDKLQQATFSNLASAAQLGGGQGFQMGTQTDLVKMMLTSGVTDQNHDDIKAQTDTLQQEAQQGIQTLNQYWVQVRDAKIQQARASDDHHTQMVRMERDYNVQMKQANDQFAVQQTESLYQFNENLRQQKYSLANAYGNASQFVQSQYTMGAGSGLIGMQRQNQMLQRSQSSMDSLSKMGLSTDAIRVMGLDQPQNVQQAEKYLKDFINNPQLIKTFNDEVAQRLNITNAIAQDPNNSQFAELQRQFQHSADVATQAFDVQMSNAKQAFDRSMNDFQTDYQTQMARAADDLSRLGEDTTKSWSDLVSWAQNSGIPGVASLANFTVGAINSVNSATAQLQQSLNNVASGFSTTLNQLGASWQSFVAQNPQFAAANGIDMSNGASSGNTIAGSPQQAVATLALSKYGWQGAEWDALSALVQRESGWNPNAKNPHSSAAGLFQKMQSAHGPVESTVEGQANWGLDYIKGRYGDPINAWKHETQYGWYAKGAVFNGAQTIGVGEAGPEAVLPLNATGAGFVARTLRASLQMMGVNPNLAQEVRRGQMTQYSSPARSEMHIHHTDASTNFTGEITVVAQDPNEMARKLAAQKRMRALTRPVAARR